MQQMNAHYQVVIRYTRPGVIDEANDQPVIFQTRSIERGFEDDGGKTAATAARARLKELVPSAVEISCGTHIVSR